MILGGFWRCLTFNVFLTTYSEIQGVPKYRRSFRHTREIERKEKKRVGEISLSFLSSGLVVGRIVRLEQKNIFFSFFKDTIFRWGL